MILEGTHEYVPHENVMRQLYDFCSKKYIYIFIIYIYIYI